MEICRAFDLFELIFMITLISLLVLSSLGIGYLTWYEFNYGTTESKAKLFEKPTLKVGLRMVISTIIWTVIYGAYLYIKSMFC